MKTFIDYWRHRWEESLGTIVLMFMATAATLVAFFFLRNKALVDVFAGIFVGIYSQAIMNVVCFKRRSMLTLCVAAALVLGNTSLPAADPPPAELPAYFYDYGSSIMVSMPPLDVPPGDPPQKLGIIGAGVCVGALAIMAGYIGVKIISACMKNYEFYVTNNAACGDCPLKMPPPFFEMTTVPVPPATGTPPGPSTACAVCDLPKPPADQPLPLQIEHSFDKVAWTVIARGTYIDDEVVMPDTGFWRIVPLYVELYQTDGVRMVHSPPGVLEHSDNLHDWTEVSRSFTDTELVAEPGFYRVRMN